MAWRKGCGGMKGVCPDLRGFPAILARRARLALIFFRARITPEIVTTIAAMRAHVVASSAPGRRSASASCRPWARCMRGICSLVDESRKRAERNRGQHFCEPDTVRAARRFRPLSAHGAPRRRGAAWARAADLIFARSAAEMYPQGYATKIEIGAGAGLERISVRISSPASRTVVGKLLIAAQFDIAVFGEKDYQQLPRRPPPVTDLALPVEIVAARRAGAGRLGDVVAQCVFCRPSARSRGR